MKRKYKKVHNYNLVFKQGICFLTQEKINEPLKLNLILIYVLLQSKQT